MVMQKITSLTNDYKQKIKIPIYTGKILELNFKYSESQSCWFYEFIYEGFRAGWYMLVNSPNALREFQFILPFGIGCSVTDGQDPYFLNDFITGRVSVYILTKDEVFEIGRKLYGKIW